MKYEKILARVRQLGGEGVQLVAVSKYTDDASVAAAVAAGCADFGENRVQDLARRASMDWGANIRWHMLGNLQSNKINMLLRVRPALWQSCISIEQALAVDARLDGALECLVEVNAAHEASKHGVPLEYAAELYAQINAQCVNLRAVGLMCIGAHTSDTAAVRASFVATRREFERCAGAKICSMGMSADYEIALECGSNLVRVGSAIFE